MFPVLVLCCRSLIVVGLAEELVQPQDILSLNVSQSVERSKNGYSFGAHAMTP